MELAVFLVCGDPAIYINGKRIAKVDASSEEGQLLLDWYRRSKAVRGRPTG